MQRIFAFAILFLIWTSTSGQTKAKKSNTQNFIFYDEQHFSLEGTLQEEKKESIYDRLPISAKEKVGEKVWTNAKCSTGIAANFSSNSKSIKLKWTLKHNTTMNHMSNAGIKGIDLYVKDKNTWRYVNTAVPTGKTNELIVIQNMSSEWRQFKLYLPLYDGIEKLEVGILEEALIKKPTKKEKRKIAFYGSSIAQGGCASRPGMLHTNIMARQSNLECFNYAVAGSGKMTIAMAKEIAKCKAEAYIITCLPNMKVNEIQSQTIPFVEAIRELVPNAAILLVEDIRNQNSFLDQYTYKRTNKKNAALKVQYNLLKEKGMEKIYLIAQKNAIGNDHEATVDGVHLNDIGFLRLASFFTGNLKQHGILPSLKIK